MSKRAFTARTQPNQVNREYSCGNAALLNDGIIRARQWQRVTAKYRYQPQRIQRVESEPAHFTFQGFRRVKSGNS